MTRSRLLATVTLVLAACVAAAATPPTFSKERLLAHVRYLADPALEGRGMGSEGLTKAGDYVAMQFAAAGLQPGGEHAGYMQNFTAPTGPDGKPHEIHNVIGYLPGSHAAFQGQAILISAHYDHLGHGWPDVRSAEKNQLYPGADDNASGVAVLLELAKVLAAGPAPQRTLVFVSFSGEEAGLLGSQYYVQHPLPVPLKGIRGVINMDTVGRLGSNPISVLAAASASEWPAIFRDVSVSTHVRSQSIEGAAQSSDQESFIRAGIPGVQIFSGVNLDYHRPSDIFDKIDGDGLVKVATVVKEAATYLAERPEPLTFTALPEQTSTAEMTQQSAEGNRRRVSLGTVPDFAFNGPGIRVASLVPESAAEKAGIHPGDIVSALDGKAIKDLGNFSELLKAYSPGQTLTVSGERDGKPFEMKATLQAR